MSRTVHRNLRLGRQWLQAGNLEQARECFRKVVEREPGHPGALHMLGLISLRRRDVDGALRALRAAARSAPKDAEIHTHLAEALRAAGDAEGAIEAGEAAAGLEPGSAPIRNNLGLALQAAGRPEEALAAFERAVEIDPGYQKAHYNLGALLDRLGRPDEAEAALLRAIELQPRYPQAWNALGVVLHRLGRPSEAREAFRKSIDTAPRYPKPHYNLGNLLADEGRLREALDAYERALVLRPDYREARVGRASLLIRLERYREAIEPLEQVLRRAPDHLPARLAMAQALFSTFRFAEAAGAYREILRLDPGNAAAQGNLEQCRAETADWENRDGTVGDLRRLVARELAQGRGSPVSPHGALFFPFSPSERLAIVRRRAERIAARVAPRRAALAFRHPRELEDGRLRIGYLSSDFRNNALAHLTAGLYALHDRERFEVFGYSLGPDDGSEYRRRIAAGCDAFVDLREASDSDAARRIHSDRIHLLVDLVGLAGGGRPEIPALRPAPVQAIWLYPGSLGGVFHDYLVGDPVATPAASHEEYGERLVLLPDSFQVNDHRQPVPEANGRREDLGLPPDGFVFCSFNAHAKIEPTIFDVWMRLLGRLPESCLWLLDQTREGRANLRREAERRGVDPGRLVFASHVPRADHLARLTLADLALDTLLCNGHTTTSDALWAGVPVVTCRGETFPSRVSASLLTAAGQPGLATRDLAQYEALALRLASDPRELAAIREALGAGRRRRPLFDTATFVRHLERAFLAMWQERGRRDRSPISV